jgi:hypothetical protein
MGAMGTEVLHQPLYREVAHRVLRRAVLAHPCRRTVRSPPHDGIQDCRTRPVETWGDVIHLRPCHGV